MDGAAKQILKERTGLHESYMQQFYVFSATERFTKKVNQQFLKNVGAKADESRMFERFITVSYCAGRFFKSSAGDRCILKRLRMVQQA